MSSLMKYRVHEVAKDFGVTSKVISDILTEYATTPKNHMQVLEDEVKLLVDNNFIGVIVDRFGTDLFIIKHDENSFIVNVRVMLSPQFYAWIFGLGGGVRILAPEKAILEFKDKILQFNS